MITTYEEKSFNSAENMLDNYISITYRISGFGGVGELLLKIADMG